MLDGWVANTISSVNPDQMLHSAASDLGLHCLHRPVFVPELKVIKVVVLVILN